MGTLQGNNRKNNRSTRKKCLISEGTIANFCENVEEIKQN